MARRGPNATIRLTTRNVSAVVANLRAADLDYRDAMRALAFEYGTKMRDLVVQLAPKETGYMARSVKLEFTEQGFGFEVGWHDKDFAPHGLPFYPVFQEFGTIYHPAQPSLFPARDLIMPEYLAALNVKITAISLARSR